MKFSNLTALMLSLLVSIQAVAAADATECAPRNLRGQQRVERRELRKAAGGGQRIQADCIYDGDRCQWGISGKGLEQCADEYCCSGRTFVGFVEVKSGSRAYIGCGSGPRKLREEGGSEDDEEEINQNSNQGVVVDEEDINVEEEGQIHRGLGENGCLRSYALCIGSKAECAEKCCSGRVAPTHPIVARKAFVCEANYENDD